MRHPGMQKLLAREGGFSWTQWGIGLRGRSTAYGPRGDGPAPSGPRTTARA
ncbi:hypothetical protein ACIP5N_33315 [Streptomyces sp. NPDC088768]|uniref:hypothetical protein n=1 Tax=Streptomyces sp. NPDC088768 TaxID=3365894 RepID=UPI00382B66DC